MWRRTRQRAEARYDGALQSLLFWRAPDRNPHVAHSSLAAQLRALSWIAIFGMIPIVFYFTSRGTWNLREQNVDAAWSAGFFMAQANSMLHGRLDVEAADIIGECF